MLPGIAKSKGSSMMRGGPHSTFGGPEGVSSPTGLQCALGVLTSLNSINFRNLSFIDIKPH